MRRAGATALLVLLLSPAVWSQQSDPPPEVSDAPVPRPDDLADPEARVPAAERAAEVAGIAEAVADAPPVWERLRESDEEFATCLAALDALGTVYSLPDPVTDPETAADCGIARPVAVSEIVPGVSLRPDNRMRCATARALAEWVDGLVVPAAAALPDRGALAALDHGTTYYCRRRNNLPDGKLSEHSFGNGIDIVSFHFESGDPIPVEPRMEDGTYEEAFQRTVRAASCLKFTTVIGPGTDDAHADHLHLDIKQRRGGYRLCQ